MVTQHWITLEILHTADIDPGVWDSVVLALGAWK